MASLVLEVSNPDTVHAIAEAAKRQGTTPEAAALELLETAVLAQRPIIKEVENLPEPLQQEVYDFARFLHMKSNGELRREFESWDAASDEDFLKVEHSMAEAEQMTRGDL